MANFSEEVYEKQLSRVALAYDKVIGAAAKSKAPREMRNDIVHTLRYLISVQEVDIDCVKSNLCGLFVLYDFFDILEYEGRPEMVSENE